MSVSDKDNVSCETVGVGTRFSGFKHSLGKVHT